MAYKDLITVVYHSASILSIFGQSISNWSKYNSCVDDYFTSSIFFVTNFAFSSQRDWWEDCVWGGLQMSCAEVGVSLKFSQDHMLVNLITVVHLCWDSTIWRLQGQKTCQSPAAVIWASILKRKCHVEAQERCMWLLYQGFIMELHASPFKC